MTTKLIIILRQLLSVKCDFAGSFATQHFQTHFLKHNYFHSLSFFRWLDGLATRLRKVRSLCFFWGGSYKAQ